MEEPKVSNEEETWTYRNLPLSFIEKRHTETIEGIDCSSLPWRLKERMKTVSVALVLCLNVGVDPPDVVKTQPCARLECWIDPATMSPPKALEAIVVSLQKQYERWQPRARYKQALDPTSEDVKKLCTSLRRNAKEERVLFHYNGHGVPKPTNNGEIWVFNRTYTQYIPLSIYDLQSWMGSPSIYVYDCSHAGLIVESFKTFAQQHENEFEQGVAQGRIPPTQDPPLYHQCIHLAACTATQMLPMNPDLPADLFTSCLTTPIKIAVRWFITRHSAKLVPELTIDFVERIPGLLSDRKTMLGELNWILTAITDTIAWNTLPRVLFVFTMILWTYYAYVIELCLITIDSLSERFILLVSYHIILIMFLWSYWKTIFAPVANVPSKFKLPKGEGELLMHVDSEEMQQHILETFSRNLPLVTRTLNGAIRYCEKCCCIKPDRAHHCSICGDCVLKMDHHCPWINNCICFMNYKFFLLFLAYSLIYAGFIAATSLRYFVQYWKGDLDRMGKFHVLFLFFVAIMFALSLVSLFGYHCYLVANNRTTLEAFRPAVFETGPDKNGFDLGFSNNFRQVFGDDKLLWCLPVWTSIGDGVVYPIRTRCWKSCYDSYELFQRLFRQDLLVASLFRNFLLAERVLRSYDCTPVSCPALPHTHQHAMWNAWDYALDLSLKQLPGIILHEKPYKQLTFFEDQLTAFEVWLQLGSPAREPPVQLPIVLQVLLSQVHRLRALELLAKFLDLGSWAVNLGLSVGIFPYVLKLLQSSARELRPLLVFIWAKILAVDHTCQGDLVREKAHTYFIGILRDGTIAVQHRTQAAFVLSCIVNNFRDGQEAALQGSLVSDCLFLLNDCNPQLRKWVTICLARLWDHYDAARWTGVRDTGHVKLYSLLQDTCSEVRAAAVYALGTFINSVTNRSEHANNIDHSIAITLYNTVSVDMSSLVRRELVASLQWIVLAFEHAFVNVAAHESNLHFGQDSGATPTLKRTASRSFMSPTASYCETTDSSERLKRVASSSSISTTSHSMLAHHGSLGALSSVSFGSVYSKIWAGLCNLEKDPHPEVAQTCSVITSYIRNKVKEAAAHAKDQVSSSMSLPPSPNRGGNYLSGESPPSLSLNTDLHRYAAKSSLANKNRKLYPITIIEEGNPIRAPLVTTEFVPWSCKYFAEQLIKCEDVDIESTTYYEREWRFERNLMVKREAQEEQKRAATSKLDTQIFSTRFATSPFVMQFHPYDQQIAVASFDNFGIWDWGRGAKICYSQAKSLKYPSNSKVTSMEWVNSHDVALLMTASDDGSVQLWHPNRNSSKEPTLISAWQAFSDMIPIKYSNSSGLLLTWEQWTQTVITAGDSRLIRLWDVEHELRSFEIPTGTDSPVTCIDSSFTNSMTSQSECYIDDSDSGDTGISMSFDPNFSVFGKQKQGLVVVGCKDGSIRLFDRRCSPSEARVKTWMEHGSWIFGVQLRGDKIVSGCIGGDVRIYDIRKSDSLHVNYVTQTNDMSAFAIHQTADIYACGLVNHSISVHNLSGRNLNLIRFYEGFMSHRMGPVSCLAFHPHRIALAAGNVDCSITLYSIEHRR